MDIEYLTARLVKLTIERLLAISKEIIHCAILPIGQPTIWHSVYILFEPWARRKTVLVLRMLARVNIEDRKSWFRQFRMIKYKSDKDIYIFPLTVY